MDFNFKKTLGQNFLIDKNIIHKIIDTSHIDSSTLVIEIGSGMGALSLDIIKNCGYAYLYEIDNRLFEPLTNKLSKYNNYTLYIKDFLKSDIYDIDKINSYDKLYVIGNLPYYITTPIIEKIINTFRPDKMVLMIQKEVGQRLTAHTSTKEYGSITVLLNYYYDIKKVIDVSKDCFVPKPNVDSMVIRLDKKEVQNDKFSLSFFSKFVRDAFQFKRKNLRNNLKNYNLDIISEVLSKYNLNLNNRAEDLSIEVFRDIANKLSVKNK